MLNKFKLTFQGIKLSHSGAGSAHSHGHMSVDMGDLSECVSRVHAAVSASLKRVGMGEARAGGGGSWSPSGVKHSAEHSAGGDDLVVRR